MSSRNSSVVDRLEARVLLTRVGVDTDFGGDGYADADGSVLVAPLTGGKVLAVGRFQSVRLHEGGTLDASYLDRGAAGSFPTREAYTALVVGQQLFIAGIQREVDGPIVAVFVRKVNLATGAAGSGFGNGGVITFVPESPTPGIGGIGGPTSMIATDDGGFIVAVTQFVEGGGGLTLHKFNADGSADLTFGDDGFVVADMVDLFVVETGYAAPAGDGKFVLLGGGPNDPTLKRFNADGSPDTTFGEQGVVTLAGTPFTAARVETVARPVVQPGGQVVLKAEQYLIRFNADGARDTSFGGGGTVNLRQAAGRHMVLDASGRIVGIAGETDLFRVLPGGALDATFDEDGFAPMSDFAPSYYANIAIDASDRILVGGRFEEPALVGRFEERYGAAVEDGVRLRVDGSDSDDTISVSRAGDDFIVTINGERSEFAASQITRVIVTGAGGDDQIDLQVDVFTLVRGGDGDDWIRTGAGADEIYGLGGADTVESGGGRDVILGGDGDDRLYGSADDDRMFGEGGSDSLAGGDGRDKLYGNRADGIAAADPAGDDSLSGNAGVATLDGGAGNDRVAGNGGHDRLHGGIGDDRIYGGTGNDWLYAGPGSDRLYGDSGPDHLYADEDEGTSGGIDILRGGKGNDALFAHDTLIDRLYGDGGQDWAATDDDDVLVSVDLIT
jgi:uncharacterized delta-60 repeat protein